MKGEPKQIFRGLDLKLYKGEKIALIGSNGAGKSTLMKLMVGLLKPSDGKVMLKGQSVGDTRPGHGKPQGLFVKIEGLFQVIYIDVVVIKCEIQSRVPPLDRVLLPGAVFKTVYHV